MYHNIIYLMYYIIYRKLNFRSEKQGIKRND